MYYYEKFVRGVLMAEASLAKNLIEIQLKILKNQTNQTKTCEYTTSKSKNLAEYFFPFRLNSKGYFSERGF